MIFEPESMDSSNNGTARLSLRRDLQLGPLLYLTGIFWLNFMARVVLAPLMPPIEKNLGISHTEAGSLFLFISIGYFSGILGSGFISANLTHRKTIVLSVWVLGIALVGVSLSPGLWAIRAGLCILGIGAGVYLPSGIATITALGGACKARDAALTA